MENQKERTFRIAGSGKERTAQDVFYGEPGIASNLRNNAGEDKLGKVAPAALTSALEAQNWTLIRRLAGEDWDGIAARATAFAKMVKAAAAKAPVEQVETAKS